MNYKAFLAALPLAMLAALPASAQSDSQIARKAADVTKAYAGAVACNIGGIDINSVFALTPYSAKSGREAAEYAVIWNGDIGCLGGSGTATTNIAIVKIGAGDKVFVDPALSSPAIDFDTARNGRVVKSGPNSLVFEQLEYGPNDANCCPSLKARVELRRDSKGNWNAAAR